jgi:hypothetical protein
MRKNNNTMMITIFVFVVLMGMVACNATQLDEFTALKNQLYIKEASAEGGSDSTEAKATLNTHAKPSEYESATEVQENNADILLSLKAKLLSLNEAKWSIEESDKARCCLAAFNLCEKAPDMTDKQFKQTRQLFLRRARNQCKEVWTVKLKNTKQICGFYATNIVNCAYTPNTEDDWNMYFNQLPDCCARAREYCDTLNPVSLFLSKRECLGYAVRTEEAICQQADTKECRGT